MENMESLSTLDISYNKLDQINLTLFPKTVETINMEDNHLTRVHNFRQANFTLLKSLYISKNLFPYAPNMEADGISLKHIYESIPEHPHIYERLRIETDPLPLSAENQHYQILRFSDNSTEEDPFSTLRRNSIFARKFVQHQNNTKNLYSVITFNRVELL